MGIVREVPEGWINAVTALSGSGPAYVFEMVQALTEAGMAQGLPADLALDLTVQTVAGAAEMLRQRQGTPEALRRAVTSPGGTTAAGLAVLEGAGFRGLVARTVNAARERADELGRRAG
jgi:pyrroline-5-carboxylate reductase